MPRRTLYPGTLVKVSEGSGSLSNRIGRIVDRRDVPLRKDGSGIPFLPGHYDRVDWNTYVAIRFEDNGQLDTLPKSWLRVLSDDDGRKERIKVYRNMFVRALLTASIKIPANRRYVPGADPKTISHQLVLEDLSKLLRGEDASDDVVSIARCGHELNRLGDQAWVREVLDEFRVG